MAYITWLAVVVAVVVLETIWRHSTFQLRKVVL